MTAGVLERAAATRPADLEPRLLAAALDRALGWGLPLLLGWVLAATGSPWTVVLGAALGLGLVLLLGTCALLAARGATPGLAATGLRLLDAGSGRPPAFAAAVRRQAVLSVAGLPTFGLGLATLAWTAVTDPAGTRRGWHDQVTGTVLVDVRPAPVVEAPRERPQPIVNLTAMRLSPTGPVVPPIPAAARPAPAAPAATETSAPAIPAQAAPAAVAPARRTPAPAAAAPVAAAGPAADAAGGAAPAAHAAPGAQPPAADPRPGRRRAGVPPVSLPVPATQVAPGPPPTQPAASRGRWRVRFDTGEDLVVEGLVLIGRGPQARPGESVAHLVPLRSADMSVSKTHAQVQPVEDGSLVAMDRGSTNGSVVIRRGVPRHLSPGRPMTLLEGDVVRFGDRAMEVSRAD